MTPPSATVQGDQSSYTPTSDDRRSTRPDEPRGGSWLSRLSVSDVVSCLALGGAILAALGWSRYSPEKALAAESATRQHADSVLAAEVLANKARIDTLFIRETFTSYMLCDNRRRAEPRALPQDCNAILESWGHR